MQSLTLHHTANRCKGVFHVMCGAEYLNRLLLFYQSCCFFKLTQVLKNIILFSHFKCRVYVLKAYEVIDTRIYESVMYSVVKSV